MASTTIARKRSAIRQFYRFLFTEQMRKDDPSVHLRNPAPQRKIPKVLSVEEVDQLLAVLRSASAPEELRLQALLEVVYASGMRVSELVGLKLETVLFGVRVEEALAVSERPV